MVNGASGFNRSPLQLFNPCIIRLAIQAQKSRLFAEVSRKRSDVESDYRKIFVTIVWGDRPGTIGD